MIQTTKLLLILLISYRVFSDGNGNFNGFNDGDFNGNFNGFNDDDNYGGRYLRSRRYNRFDRDDYDNNYIYGHRDHYSYRDYDNWRDDDNWRDYDNDDWYGFGYRGRYHHWYFEWKFYNIFIT